MTDWISLFVTYRVVVVRGNEVVQGILYPGLTVGHPLVRTALDRWEGSHFVQETPFGTEVTLVRRTAPQTAERWWLHVLLLLLTLFSTTAAGAMFRGYDPLRLALVPLGPVALPLPVGFAPAEMLPGLVFSLSLLGILLGHEMGHYLLARWHKMDVSPPYFIPVPPWLNVIGTFGAFIRLRSPMINRAMLLDVGMAGPIASFVLSIPICVIGLAQSRVLDYPGIEPPAPFAVLFGAQPIWLGGSPLFELLAWLFAPTGTVLLLHPLAFAGWLGLFVTALNLFPLSQLDGGHILYALVRNWQQTVGVAFLALLLALGTLWWGWWLWAGIILLLGRGRVSHPAVLDPDFPVAGPRQRLGWACVIIFALTFVPVPLQV